MKKIITFSCIVLLFGCSAKQLICKSNTTATNTNNEYFKADFKPVLNPQDGYFRAFILTIDNKSNKDLELIWDKTLFIENGETKGGFMFEGIIYADRNNPKPPDIIFANKYYSKTVFPNVFVDYYQGWYHSMINVGNYGIYLTIKVDGKEINEKMFSECHYMENK